MYYMKLSRAVVAYWAHNPEVRGSNPARVLLFSMDLLKVDSFRDHPPSIIRKLCSSLVNAAFLTLERESERSFLSLNVNKKKEKILQ